MFILIYGTVILFVFTVQYNPAVFGSIDVYRSVCNKTGVFSLFHQPQLCPTHILSCRNTIYLLYDVNPSEGFNLHRDVYIRLAVFTRNLQRREDYRNVRLVLPPFRRLYHWKSDHFSQENLPWSMFFDIASLRRYAPVLDFPEFLDEYATFEMDSMNYVQVHRIFQLQQFEEMFESGIFRDRFDIGDCDNHVRRNIMEQPMLMGNKFQCLRFQGSAGMLEKVLRQTLTELQPDDSKVFAFLNAEIVLHDHWGDREFWQARRSMRFAPNLVHIADHFRLHYFNSSDRFDKVQRPTNWQMEKPYRGATGGSYMCAHIRRGDFLHGRAKTVPTLKSAATQIKEKMQQLNLNRCFLATDANQYEFKNFKKYMEPINVVRFTTESLQKKVPITDGGIAIVDQLVCAHAKHFIGTYESTFTYRIYEEREILGFPTSSTFNTLCKDEHQHNCLKNSVWPITY